MNVCAMSTGRWLPLGDHGPLARFPAYDPMTGDIEDVSTRISILFFNSFLGSFRVSFRNHAHVNEMPLASW